jgi:tRNA U34 5-methylaminomethyl-2-thiouridine-forming methyltransferase MnmC
MYLCKIAAKMNINFSLKKEIFFETTGDGSFTLYVPELDEHYHSMNGAVQESRHVYISAGLNHYIDSFNDNCKEIQVLEFGFGTGLNAFLTALEAEKQKIKIRYTALEKYPLPQEITNQLNYSSDNQTLFQGIHQSAWENPVLITPCFTLQKSAIDFADFDFPDRYDVVYYDAFAPDKQPEVWTQKLFDKIFAAMNSGGVLTTYCAKGNIRRMMQQAGFSVERIPGAPGKREMLRANVLSNADDYKEYKEQQQ